MLVQTKYASLIGQDGTAFLDLAAHDIHDRALEGRWVDLQNGLAAEDVYCVVRPHH
jgi:hypothetical protein